MEFKAECELCQRKREILEQTHVIGSVDRPPGKEFICMQSKISHDCDVIATTQVA